MSRDLILHEAVKQLTVAVATEIIMLAVRMKNQYEPFLTCFPAKEKEEHCYQVSTLKQKQYPLYGN